MKAWKVWTTIASVIVLGTAVGITTALWNNISSEWQVESNAAQYALNHSPIDHILTHSVFTGSQAQEVFFGTDAFKRPWYAFVYGSPFTIESVPATGLLTKAAVNKQMTNQKIQPLQDALGYLNPDTQAALNTTSTVVWEVYGRQTSSGKFMYVYVNAQTGAIVWKYVL